MPIQQMDTSGGYRTSTSLPATGLPVFGRVAVSHQAPRFVKFNAVKHILALTICAQVMVHRDQKLHLYDYLNFQTSAFGCHANDAQTATKRFCRAFPALAEVQGQYERNDTNNDLFLQPGSRALGCRNPRLSQTDVFAGLSGGCISDQFHIFWGVKQA